ncbi:MAG: segregation/condensation protein A [Candidatus Buchananbacteria bacterium]
MINFKLEKFEGPLDLLLQLIESEQLDITQVSLSRVAEQYLEYIKTSTALNPEELADFLVVAAKLLIIKSKILLPDLGLSGGEEADTLERQLKIYKEFLEASKLVHQILLKKCWSFSREKISLLNTPTFYPPPGVDQKTLNQIFLKVLGKIQPIIALPKKLIARTISLQERIKSIKDRILQEMVIKFNSLMGDKNSKVEKIVNFLAVLELIKQREVSAEQGDIFEDIIIKRLQNN